MENNTAREIWRLLDTERMHPGFSVDCAVLCYHEKKLKILLTKFKIRDYWALPGGFMYEDEDAAMAAKRVLEMRVGVNDITLTQFHLFSSPTRTVIEQNKSFVDENKINAEAEKWLVRRFVSLGFYSLVQYDDVDIQQLEGEIIKWYDIDELPSMYADHQDIIETALKLIPTLMPMIYVANALLPEKFTITDIRLLYERLLGKEYDRRNFQRKMLSDGYVIQLDEKEKSNAYNPPFLYSFNTQRIRTEFEL